MRFPLMLRRTHMREHVEQAEAYRWRIDAAERGRQKAESKLVDWTRQFHDVPTAERDYQTHSRLIAVRVSEELLFRLHSTQDLAEMLSRGIVSTLLGANRDLRGDMREDPRQRLLR